MDMKSGCPIHFNMFKCVVLVDERENIEHHLKKTVLPEMYSPIMI